MFAAIVISSLGDRMMTVNMCCGEYCCGVQLRFEEFCVSHTPPQKRNDTPAPQPLPF